MKSIEDKFEVEVDNIDPWLTFRPIQGVLEKMSILFLWNFSLLIKPMEGAERSKESIFTIRNN